MGYAARAQKQPRREVFWATCEVCQLEFPTDAKPDPLIERLNICQRCCVADVATLMRALPGTVCLLPTVRALQGKSQAVPVYPSFQENIVTTTERVISETKTTASGVSVTALDYDAAI